MTAHPTATGIDSPAPHSSAVLGEGRPPLVRAGQLAVVLLACAYLVQVLTPLRIDSDSAFALSVGIQLAEDGVVHGGAIPLGYPAMVALLIKAGVGSSAALVFLNLAFLAIGCRAVWWIARDTSSEVRWWTVAFTLLSHPIIRNSVSPYPDIIGFGLTLTAVALLSSVSSERSRQNLMLIVGAALITILLATLRIAGLILVVPIAWCVFRIFTPGGARERRQVVLALAVLTVIFIGIAVVVASTQDGTFVRYGEEIRRHWFRPPLAQAIHRVSVMFRAIGELSLNVPMSWMPQLRPYLWILGIIPSIALLRMARRAVWTRPVSVFVVTFLAVLLVWPFYATRLWLPLIPLLILKLVHGALSTPLTGYRRALAGTLAVVYITGGLFALAYTTRVSLSGEDFRRRWGLNGGMASPGYEAGGHNARARDVIRKLDAGNPAWRWLDTVPERVFTENLPLRSR